jgi:tripartite-type tricarboxylate transporter receptor subunit TctC
MQSAGSTKEGLVSNSKCHKTKVETPPMVSKSRLTQRRVVGARLHGHPLSVKATKLPRRQFLHLAAGAATLPAASRIARAQTYPSRPITMIVSVAAGSQSDVAGRIIAERMRERLGRPVIIENISGADGSIGAGRTARAKPDGYTIDIGFLGNHVLNGAFYSLNYDLLNGFAPISPLTTSPFFLYAKKTVPARNLTELIAWLKSNPKGSAGSTAAAGRLVTSVFERETGTRLAVVPYRGSNAVFQDLMGGQIDISFNSSDGLPLVRAGSLKAYAATSNTRLTAAPDIPTFAELGFPKVSWSAWNGLFAPKGTPKDIIAKLNEATLEALADPAVRSRLADLGQEVFPPEQRTPEALAALVKADAEKWWPIIKAAGI